MTASKARKCPNRRGRRLHLQFSTCLSFEALKINALAKRSVKNHQKSTKYGRPQLGITTVSWTTQSPNHPKRRIRTQQINNPTTNIVFHSTYRCNVTISTANCWQRVERDLRSCWERRNAAATQKWQMGQIAKLCCELPHMLMRSWGGRHIAHARHYTNDVTARFDTIIVLKFSRRTTFTVLT